MSLLIVMIVDLTRQKLIDMYMWQVIKRKKVFLNRTDQKVKIFQ